MKRIALTILNIIFGIIVFVIVVISSMIIRNNNLSDFFTHKRISALDNRPKEFTHDIIVDLSTTAELGGVLTLTENILQGIMKKRPNWRLILLINELTNNHFQKFAACNQVKMINVKPYGFVLQEIIFHLANSITFGFARNKLEQIVFHGNLFADDKCDMFWDPGAGHHAKYPIHVPSICTIHDLASKDMGAILSDGECIWQRKCTEESIKKVESIITVSDFSKRRIIEEFNLPADMIEVIHIKMANRLKSGPPNETYEKTVLRKYDLKSKKYLIFISTLWPHKNHDRLLKAFEIFLKDSRNAKIKDIKLTIVGYGTMKKTLSAAKELKIENEVVAPGFISEKELDIIL
ncbi:MAG: glycosyltransferase, partial [Holosporaceae bacterium]|nr:glycosyltransferase [Holosporaceae bacterium]